MIFSVLYTTVSCPKTKKRNIFFLDTNCGHSIFHSSQSHKKITKISEKPIFCNHLQMFVYTQKKSKQSIHCVHCRINLNSTTNKHKDIFISLQRTENFLITDYIFSFKFFLFKIVQKKKNLSVLSFFLTRTRFDTLSPEVKKIHEKKNLFHI